MKQGRQYVDKEEFLRIAKESGCKIELQAGFHKCTKEGAAAIIYVSKTASCGRIDISNTIIEGHPDEVEDLGGASYGKVHQRVNFGGEGENGQKLVDRNRDQILEFFRWLCDNLATFPALPRKERARPVGLKGSKKKDAPAEVQVSMELSPQQQIDELLKKRKLMQDAASRYNSPVSKKMMDSIAAKLQALGYVEKAEVQA